MCKVLNRKDGVPKGAVSIGRPSKFGNPFIIGVHGDRNEVCDKFDTLDKTHLINIPCLIIAGKTDRLTPLKYQLF